MKLKTLLILCCVPALLHGRSRDSVQLHWKITTKPTELVLGNVPLTVEKVFKQRTLGFTIAYRPSTRSGGEVMGGGSGLFGNYEYQYVWNRVVEGAYVGINSKNYFRGKGRRFYIDPELFCRRWWCNDKIASYRDVEGYNFNATRTEAVNVIGLKLLCGHSFIFCKTKAVKLVLDTYCGIGVRYKTWKYESTNGTVNNMYFAHKTENGSIILPSLHVGVQFGLGF